MAVKALTIGAICAFGTQAIELTPANWDAETAGKSVFVKFLAPW